MGRSWKAYENLYSRVDVGTLVRFGDQAGETARTLPTLLIHRQKDVLEKGRKAGSSVSILLKRKGTCPSPYRA